MSDRDHATRRTEERWTCPSMSPNWSNRTWQVTTDLLAIANAEGVFIPVNPAWEAVLGWSQAETAQISFLDLIHPDDLPKTRAASKGCSEVSRSCASRTAIEPKVVITAIWHGSLCRRAACSIAVRVMSRRSARRPGNWPSSLRSVTVSGATRRTFRSSSTARVCSKPSTRPSRRSLAGRLRMSIGRPSSTS